MTLTELIDVLTELAEGDDRLANAPVMLMTQQDYPLRAHVHGVWLDEDTSSVHIVEGDQPSDDPYGTSRAWNEAIRG